ncbi:SLC44A1 [Symbiodinium sp. CCMP2592]|nr:SLC44A1 [Symbiodinium sp. CCMP2592]
MWTSPVSKREAMDKNARDWQMGTDLANEGSRLWGKMQGYIQGHTPLDTERHCTDCLFIPLFLAAIVGLCLCINHAMEKGSFERLTSLPDFEGHLCGTGGQGQYVYFCQQGGTLDLQHQICVPSCPVDSSTQIFCRGTGTNQPSYATHPVAGMLCMPAAAEVASQVKHLFDSNPYLKTLFELVEVTFDWEQLIVAAVVASVVSYLYLFCISLCASFLVWLCLIALVVLPTCLGLVYVYMSASPEIIVPNSFPAMITSGDTRNDLTVGLSLCGVGGLLACVAMVKAKTIQAAVVSIEEAADCIRQMPVLAVEPWISVVIKLLFFVPGMLGLLMLNVSGDLPSQVDFSQGQPVYSGDPMVAISLVYYFVVFVWIMELLHSVSQFVVMFTAQVWFFRMKGYETSFWAHFTAYDMLWGFVYGLGYHLGSLLYGSFLCTLFRVARIFASLLMHASQNSGNPVAECVAKCFVCCLSCAEKLMQYVTSMAYCDIVMNSTTYCEGAEHAVQIVSGNASQLVAVEGLATMFSFVGVGVSSAATAGICWFLSTTFSRYSSPVSDHYVPDKQTMVICAAVIGAVMAADDWLSLFGLEPKEAEPKKPEPERCTAGGRMRAPGLRDLMSDVPKEFCCALDGRLLVDPVRAPGGHVYERSVLAKALAEGDPRVLSDSPYTLQDCQRDTGLRARIVDWVRSTHSQSKEKRISGSLVLMHRGSSCAL